MDTHPEHQNVQGAFNQLPGTSPHRIGDRGPGGGTVFFAQGGDNREASSDLGTGLWAAADQAARDLRSGGFTDWRLPTQHELDNVYRNLKLAGFTGFVEGVYWSSTSNAANPTNTSNRWGQNFSTSDIWWDTWLNPGAGRFGFPSLNARFFAVRSFTAN